MGIFNKLGNFQKTGRSLADHKGKAFFDLVQKEPENPNAHMKLAEICQKNGEKEKAISEYLLAADIFVKDQFYARAIAIYKQLTKRYPNLDHVYLKMAEIYREKGFLGESLAQYRILVQYYKEIGEKDNALNILKIMDKLDPPKMNSHDGGLSRFFSHSDQIEALPGQETASEESSFDLITALTKAESLEIDASKEVQILESIDGVERILKKLKHFGGPNMFVVYHE